MYKKYSTPTTFKTTFLYRTHVTYEDYTELQIPNTTNLLEGFNSQLKRALHNHNGLNEANKKKFIDGFINTKSRLE